MIGRSVGRSVRRPDGRTSGRSVGRSVGLSVVRWSSKAEWLGAVIVRGVHACAPVSRLGCYRRKSVRERSNRVPLCTPSPTYRDAPRGSVHVFFPPAKAVPCEGEREASPPVFFRPNANEVIRRVKGNIKIYIIRCVPHTGRLTYRALSRDARKVARAIFFFF